MARGVFTGDAVRLVEIIWRYLRINIPSVFVVRTKANRISLVNIIDYKIIINGNGNIRRTPKLVHRTATCIYLAHKSTYIY